MPMAMLEDVLVPVYFYHRYQVEAATKVVGGMYYNYSLRGDGRGNNKIFIERRTIKSPQCNYGLYRYKILKITGSDRSVIPPLPAGYGFSRELFRNRTGLAFDVLSPAETAADLPFIILI